MLAALVDQVGRYCLIGTKQHLAWLVCLSHDLVRTLVQYEYTSVLHRKCMIYSMMDLTILKLYLYSIFAKPKRMPTSKKIVKLKIKFDDLVICGTYMSYEID